MNKTIVINKNEVINLASKILDRKLSAEEINWLYSGIENYLSDRLQALVTRKILYIYTNKRGNKHV